MEVVWGIREGIIYVDGCYVIYLVKYGDIIELLLNVLVLKVFLFFYLLLISGFVNLWDFYCVVIFIYEREFLYVGKWGGLNVGG